MNSILMRNNVTEKDQIEYIKTQIERILCLPFNYQLHADAKFWCSKLNGDIKNYYKERIRGWFDGDSDEKRIGVSD